MTYPDTTAVDDFRPSHVVPSEGLAAWEAPDVSRPTAALDAFLPVQLLSRRGEWAEILCANGWSAWVDGRLLVAVPQPPPTADGRPVARSEDPGPLLARGAEALERYRRAVDDLAAGRADGESFRRSVQGLRAGIVIDGESVWLYDETTGRWLFGDEGRLATYAVVAGPGDSPAQEPPRASDPGRVADVGKDGTPADSVGDRLDVLPDGSSDHDPTRIVDEPGAR
uniref:Uncharacterized protein n=1 Tax=Streptomyces sp. NBC_00049 TaxID=2903617 RepID=A0AAU2JL18_9ACTN